MKTIFRIISITILVFLFTINLFSENDVKVLEIKYFHATMRCPGCIQIEDFIYKSVETVFSEKLNDSSLRIQSIDFMQKENEHFQDFYKFDSQTLILSKKVNGKEIKWKNLDKIWDYSSDIIRFQKYIEEEINDFLKN